MNTPTPPNSEPERDLVRERVDRAEHVLATHYRWNRNRSVPDELCELLIDLMHWAYHDDTDFGEKCGWAEAVFEEELKANPPKATPYRVSFQITQTYEMDIEAETADDAIDTVQDQLRSSELKRIPGASLCTTSDGEWNAEELPS